jgi:hypothetical protein
MDLNIVEHLGSPSEAAQSESLEVVHPDDDERLYPKFVERWDMVETEGDEGMPAQFDEIDEEESEESINMGVDQNEEDEGRSVIEYDRDNPSLIEGSIFPSMTDCRNAPATYCIKGEFDFVIDKSESNRLTVHYA